MAKKKIEIEFWRKVQYYVEIEVTDEQLELLQENDGNDIKQYFRNQGDIESNPAFEILQDYANESNECDWEGEFEDFNIVKGGSEI